MTTRKHTPDNTESKHNDTRPRPTVQHGAHSERVYSSPEHQQRLFFKERLTNLENTLRNKESVIEVLEVDKRTLVETIAAAAVREHTYDQERIRLARENTQLKHDYEQLKKYAHIDERTGLERAEVFNNIGFPRAFGTAMRHNLNLALIIIDLNNLKVTNDTQSYEAGNKLLARTANAIKDTIRSEDSRYKFEEGYRWGGDEFVILANMPHSKPEETHSRAKAIVQRLEESLQANKVDSAIGVCVITSRLGMPAHEDKESMIAYLEKPYINVHHKEITKADVGNMRDRMFKSAEKEMKKDKAKKKGKPIIDAKRDE